jgi:hypothetical protein
LNQKRQFFRRFFRRKYLKNHNIGPWSPWPIVGFKAGNKLEVGLGQQLQTLAHIPEIEAIKAGTATA